MKNKFGLPLFVILTLFFSGAIVPGRQNGTDKVVIPGLGDGGDPVFRAAWENLTNQYCHDLKQTLYVFENYKNNPGPMQTGSVIFNAADFDSLNKQDKFKGLVIYKLAGEELVPFK